MEGEWPSRWLGMHGEVFVIHKNGDPAKPFFGRCGLGRFVFWW
jgi:hypothetical protein